jgi:lipid-A-disaccharide synthase
VTTLFVSANDASGDVHAAALVRALRPLVPDLRVVGLGGAELEKAGCELLVSQREIAVGGLVEVLPGLPRIVSAWRTLTRSLAELRPELVLLVDSPDLNLPLARRARRLGLPVLYYVCPQVWAWRRGRVRKIARRVDRMAAIFPFEVEVFAGTGLSVDFVGHPLVESTQRVLDEVSPAAARRALGLGEDDRVVALLPGSRRGEIAHVLPLFLETARALHARDPRLVFAIAVAPTVSLQDVVGLVRQAKLPSLLRVHTFEGRTHEVVRAARVALAKPGTVSLEVVLLGTPLVVAGRAHPLTAAVLRRVVRVPSLTMANLIAGAPVVPELLQEQARPERIALAVWTLLDGAAREAQLARFAALRRRLGDGGAAERAARIACEMLHGSPAA